MLAVAHCAEETRIQIDIKPDIYLKPYANIKINKLSEEVTEEDVSKALEAVRDTAAHFEVIEGRPIAMGDYVVCDYDCLVEGKSIDNQKNIWLNINEEPSLSEVKKALINCNKGGSKEVALVLPKNYKMQEHAGKNAIYKITVNEIKQKVLPVLDDALAKQVGEFESLQKLKDRLKDEINYSKKQQQRSDMENQLFDFLLKNNQFDVPESVVESQLQTLVDDAKIRLAYQGCKKEDIEPQAGKLKESLAINAKNQVRVFFILNEIAQKEKIRITSEEINAHIEKMADANKQDKVKLRKTLEEKGLMDNIMHQLLHDKVANFLLEKADVNEVK